MASVIGCVIVFYAGVYPLIGAFVCALRCLLGGWIE